MRSLRLPSSLFARLLMTSVLLAVIPLAIVGAIAYYQGQRTLRQNILDHLTTTAILKEEEINRWVGAMEQDVRLLAADPALRQWGQVLLADPLEETSNAGQGSGALEDSTEAYEALHGYLDRVLAEKPDFLEILLLRAVGGEVVLSTNKEYEGSYEVTSSFFTEGRKSTFVQNIYPSVSLGKPAMTVATPMVDDDGETMGVLAVHLDLAQLDTIMLERGGLGETGETYLVDQFNVFVSEARFGQESFPRGVHTEGIDSALLDKEDGAGVYENYREVPVIGAYRWLDEREVALLAEIEQDEAMAPVRTLALTVLAVGIGIAGLVVLSAYAVARQISRPILSMAETSTVMAAGELDQTAALEPIERREDEIGILARSFSGMATQLRNLIGELERRVAERTEALRNRAVQLETAAEVGRAAASILEMEALTRRVVDLVRDRFDLYYAGLFLIEDREALAADISGAGAFAVLVAGTGAAGQQMKEQGHKLEVGGKSMVGSACAHHEARIALDVEEEGASLARFDNPLLPETRSEMALPLMVGDHVLGALDVQSTRAAAFSEEDIAVLQLVADQVAVAVENARKFSEEAALLEATSPLYRASRRLATAVSREEIVDQILASVAETEADACAIGLVNLTEAGEIASCTFLDVWERGQEPSPAEASAGRFPRDTTIVVDEAGVALPVPLPLEMVTSYWHVEDAADLLAAEESADAGQFLEWLGSRSFVNIPLRSGERPVGFVGIHRSTPGAFSPLSLRLYETLGDQAAVALERARLLEEAQRRAAHEQTLSQLTAHFTRSLDMDTLLQIAVRELGQLPDVTEASVYIEASKKGYRQRHLEVEPFGEEPPESSQARASGHPVILTQAEGAADAVEEGPATALAVPMRLREQTVGSLSLRLDGEGVTPGTVALMEEVANRLALALESARLYEDAQRRAARDRQIEEIASHVQGSLDPDNILKTAVRELGRALEAEWASIEVTGLEEVEIG